jgi:antitoxin CptB
MTEHNNRLKKILYRSLHRGCKETDFLLGKFAQAHLNELSPEEIDFYERFIELSDNDIYNWIAGNAEIPANYHHPLIQKIIEFNAEHAKAK